MAVTSVLRSEIQEISDVCASTRSLSSLMVGSLSLDAMPACAAVRGDGRHYFSYMSSTWDELQHSKVYNDNLSQYATIAKSYGVAKNTYLSYETLYAQ